MRTLEERSWTVKAASFRANRALDEVYLRVLIAFLNRQQRRSMSQEGWLVTSSAFGEM